MTTLALASPSPAASPDGQKRESSSAAYIASKEVPESSYFATPLVLG